MEEISRKDFIDKVADEIAEELSNSKEFSNSSGNSDELQVRVNNIEEQLNKLIYNHKIIMQKIQKHDEEFNKVYSELENALETVLKVADKIKSQK
jgi:hypothetical protein